MNFMGLLLSTFGSYKTVLEQNEFLRSEVLRLGKLVTEIQKDKVETIMGVHIDEVLNAFVSTKWRKDQNMSEQTIVDVETMTKALLDEAISQAVRLDRNFRNREGTDAIPTKTTIKRTVYVKDIIKNHE